MNKLLIALAAGFVAGVLLAPDKGSATRKKIKDGFQGLADGVNDLVDRFAPAVVEEVEAMATVPKMSDEI
ncbi:MAG: YtxH domain-containing protein [Chitinophagaceae bacterium]